MAPWSKFLKAMQGIFYVKLSINTMLLFLSWEAMDMELSRGILFSFQPTFLIIINHSTIYAHLFWCSWQSSLCDRAVLGSTSDYCAHHAHCSVMIVKKPKIKAWNLSKATPFISQSKVSISEEVPEIILAWCETIQNNLVQFGIYVCDISNCV